MPETSAPPHQTPIIEITSVIDRLTGMASGVGKTLKLISGAEAFRRYNWLRGLPVYNVSGNLRGMVTSPGWRVIFETTSETLNVIDNISLIAGFANNIAEQSTNVSAIIRSNEPTGMKGLRLATVAGTAAERTLLSPVSSGASVILQSLQGYCGMIGLAGGSAQSFAGSCVSNLRKANNTVQSTFKLVTDTNNQAQAIYWITAKITSY
ncbi:MAG TPA: hypothetical protein VGK01_14950 [Candidatus Angelobacter sp.]